MGYNYNNEPTDFRDAEPVAQCTAPILDMFEAMAAEHSILRGVGKRQHASVIAGIIQIHPHRLRHDRRNIGKVALVTNVQNRVAREVLGNEIIVPISKKELSRFLSHAESGVRISRFRFMSIASRRHDIHTCLGAV